MHTICIVAGQLFFQAIPLLMLFHCVVVPWKVIVWSALQLENAHSPIDVTEEGIVMLWSALQLENAHSPIDVTEEGIVMLWSALQSRNE